MNRGNMDTSVNDHLFCYSPLIYQQHVSRMSGPGDAALLIDTSVLPVLLLRNLSNLSLAGFCEMIL